MAVRRVATCKPGKPGLTSFSETLALFFIQFLSFRKMKIEDKQNGPSGLPEKNWLATRLAVRIHRTQSARSKRHLYTEPYGKKHTISRVATFFACKIFFDDCAHVPIIIGHYHNHRGEIL